ncbi:MAG: SMP-30/gluconolactonase/LRE family protein [Steroidobacteraceae bacterium]
MIPEQVSREGGSLLECPIWDAQHRRVLYLDLADPHVFAVDAATGATIKKRLPLQPPLGGLCTRAGGGYLIFNSDGAHHLNSALEITALALPPHEDFSLAPPNDVSVAPDGQVLVMTADRLEIKPTGGLFAVERSLGWRRLCGEITVGNGPAIAPDGRSLYLADSPNGVIYAYRLQVDPLMIFDKRVFALVHKNEGYPDGLTVDAEGCVWNARWGGSAIVRYSTAGKVLDRISMPARYVTSCAFGDSDLGTLFITTASQSVTGSNPSCDEGGQLFRLTVSVPGTILPDAQV